MAISSMRVYSGVLFNVFLLNFLIVVNGDSCDGTTPCTESSNTTKIPIYVGVMLSMSGWDGSGCLVAADLALEQINSRTDILPDYELKMVWDDTQCTESRGTRALFGQVFKKPQKLLILGPPCAPAAVLVAAAASYYNLITVLSSALGPSLADRDKYPNVYRTVPIAINDPLIWLMKTHGWRRVAHLADSTDSIIARQDIRIVFTYIFEYTARVVLCTAFKTGFYGPHLFWVIPNWYEPNWWLVDTEAAGCTIEEMTEMIESSIILGTDVSVVSPLEKETVAGITPAEFVKEIDRRLLWPEYETLIWNNYVGYIYDAFWAVALMFNRTASTLKERNINKRLEEFTYKDGELYNMFFKGLALTDFFGVTGAVFFTEGERLGNADITQIKGVCPSGWHLYNRHCFRMFDEISADWSSGAMMCESEGAGTTDLSTYEELTFLSRLRTSKNNEWYVGLHFIGDDTNTSTLVDVNNSTSDRMPLFGGYGDCVYVDFEDNTLKTGDCQERRPFICKSKAAISQGIILESTLVSTAPRITDYFHRGTLQGGETEYRYVLLAIYDSGTGETVWKEDIYWPGGKVVADGPDSVAILHERREALIPAYIHLSVASLAAAGFLLIVVILSANMCVPGRRKYRSLDGFDFSIFFSCLLMYLSTIFTKSELLTMISDQQDGLICQIHDIASSVGFTLGVATLVEKLWHVYSSASINHVESTKRRKYIIIILFLLIDISCIALLNLTYPLTRETFPLAVEDEHGDANHVIEYHVKVCTRGTATLPIILGVADKVVLLLIGAFLSIEMKQARHVMVEEARHVSASIYNIMMFGGCGLILVALTRESPTEAYVFSSGMVLCCTTITMLIIYIPKTKSTREHSQLGKSSMAPPTSQMTESERDHLRAENRQLKKEYELLRRLIPRGWSNPALGMVVEEDA